MTDVHFEFPLQWLPQQSRTKLPKRALFGNHNSFYAGERLVDELLRLGAKNVIISSNLQTRSRGQGFLSNQIIKDVGVVAYFDLKGQPKAMACDKWDKPEHNLWALFLSIQAIRGLERWGGSEFLDGLFTGFKALPETTIVNTIQYFSEFKNKAEAKARFVELVKVNHPDVGGDAEIFMEIKKQYDVLK